MRSLYLIIISLFCLSKVEAQIYDLRFKVKGIENDTALLAYNYSDKKYIRDSIIFKNGIGELKGEKNYEPGVYLVVFPSKGNNYFEFIMKEPQVELSTSTDDLVGNMTVKYSEENKIFYEDVKFMIKQGKQIDSLKIKMEEVENDTISKNNIQKKIDNIATEIKEHRKKIVNKHPNLLYAKLLNVLRDIEIPETPVNERGKKDPNFPYYYLKNHYFDGVDFNEIGLIRTPVLVPKITKFMDEMVVPVPDSLKVAASSIVEKAKVNSEMFRIVLSELLNKYAKSNIMGQEAVYVHLIDLYYATGQTPWVDEETLQKMKDRAEALRPTLIGKIAPDMNVYTLNNAILNFYKSIEGNKYTILAFWNSDCGHCKKEIPEIMKVWEDSLQNMGVGVFSVSTEVENDLVTKFVEEKELQKWTNGYDPTGRAPFRKLYDLISTPVVIILDADKKIIAKKVGVKDIKFIIDSHNEYLKLQAERDKK